MNSIYNFSSYNTLLCQLLKNIKGYHINTLTNYRKLAYIQKIYNVDLTVFLTGKVVCDFVLLFNLKGGNNDRYFIYGYIHDYNIFTNKSDV